MYHAAVHTTPMPWISENMVNATSAPHGRGRCTTSRICSWGQLGMVLATRGESHNIYIYINIFVDIDLIKIGYFTPPENQQPCVPHDPAEASQVTGSTKEENYQSKGFQFWILTLPWNHWWGLLQQGHNPNQIQIRRAVTRHYKNHSNILFFYSSSPKSKLDKCLAFGLGYR